MRGSLSAVVGYVDRERGGVERVFARISAFRLGLAGLPSSVRTPERQKGGRLTPLASDLPEGVASVVGCGPVPCGRGSDRGPTKKNPGGVTFRMQSCILRSCGAGISPPAMPIP